MKHLTCSSFYNVNLTKILNKFADNLYKLEKRMLVYVLASSKNSTFYET